MTFRVGQKVVCVDKSRGFKNMLGEWSDDARLQLNAIYTIRAVGIEDGNQVVWLQEILNRIAPKGKRAANEGADLPYGAFRFRPIVEKKTDISIFTALLDPANHKKLEDA